MSEGRTTQKRTRLRLASAVTRAFICVDVLANGNIRSFILQRVSWLAFEKSHPKCADANCRAALRDIVRKDPTRNMGKRGTCFISWRDALPRIALKRASFCHFTVFRVTVGYWRVAIESHVRVYPGLSLLRNIWHDHQDAESRMRHIMPMAKGTHTEYLAVPYTISGATISTEMKQEYMYESVFIPSYYHYC